MMAARQRQMQWKQQQRLKIQEEQHAAVRLQTLHRGRVDRKVRDAKQAEARRAEEMERLRVHEMRMKQLAAE